MDDGSPNPANPPVFGPESPPGVQDPNVGVTVPQVEPASGSNTVKEQTSKEVMSPKADGTTSIEDLKLLIMNQMQVLTFNFYKVIIQL